VRLRRPSGDTGEAASGVTAALAAYADGTGSEHAALLALAAARLLVPVVAVLAAGGDEELEPPMRGGPQGGRPPRSNSDGAEKESEMALPTLIGNDGRTAIIAFTGTETLSRWQEDARPVPVPAWQVWAAAHAEADAAVIDVAGPVPLVIEGARLRALANGQPPPLPHEDPDIHAEVAAVTPDFILESGGRDTDLAVTLTIRDMDQVRRYAEQIAIRLSVRLRRGIEIRASLSRTHAADSPAPL
jgi:SseB protein N-terminal domain